MLNAPQKDQFNSQGFLVVEDVLEPARLNVVQDEYAALLDSLYAGWLAEGRVGPPATPDFWGKLLTGQPSGRSHFLEFVARSACAPHRVLDGWRVWRTMWEDARTRLATQPHIQCHHWTSESPHCA